MEDRETCMKRHFGSLLLAVMDWDRGLVSPIFLSTPNHRFRFSCVGIRKSSTPAGFISFLRQSWIESLRTIVYFSYGYIDGLVWRNEEIFFFGVES